MDARQLDPLVLPHDVARGARQLDLHRSPLADRLVVLGYLVVLGGVRVEIILPVPLADGRDLAPEKGAPAANDLVQGLLVHDRRRAPAALEIDRVGERVLRFAEARRNPREHLRAGLQLDVNLQTYDGFVGHRLGRRPCQSVRPWYVLAIARSSVSLKGWPITWRPIGSPAPREAARDADTRRKPRQVDPDRENVVRSGYIASGSGGLLPPLEGGGVGEVGGQDRVDLPVGLQKILRRIMRAHLLRAQVEGIVVAAREDVGPEDDPALDLIAESLRPAT